MSLLLRTKHEPEKSLAGNHKRTIIVHTKDTLFDGHECQAVEIDLNKGSVSFAMSIGPVWPLTPFLKWFTPTADKGQSYNLKWWVLAVFVPLSAWINHFHLKARDLMLWAILRSKAVCTDFQWISLWVKPEIRKTGCEGWGKGKPANYIYPVSVEVRIIPSLKKKSSTWGTPVAAQKLM